MRYKWILGSIIVLAFIAGGCFSACQSFSRHIPPPPDKSHAVIDDKTTWIDRDAKIINVNVTITNMDNDWSITNINLQADALNTDGKILQTFKIKISPETIPPGGKGTAEQTLQFPADAVRGHNGATWGWIRQ
jgi:hypothetical protein